MGISLKNLLLIAEKTGTNPDGSNFDQRSLGYGDNKPLITRDLPSVEKQTNGVSGLVNEITDNFVRGGVLTATKSAATDLLRLSKVLLSPKGLSWVGIQTALAKTNPDTLVSPTNRQSLGATSLLGTAGAGVAGIRFRKDGILDTEFESGYNYDPSSGGPKYENLLVFKAANNEESDNNTLKGLYTNVNLLQRGPIDELKRYNGGPHSIAGIGETKIKRYKSNLYNDIGKNGGYLPFFNNDLFALRQGETPRQEHNDYRSVPNTLSTNEPIPNEKTKINLYKLGDPGAKPTGRGESYGVYDVRTVDRISAASIFQRQNSDEDFSGTFKDYIKFRIAVVDTENPLKDNVILFRAFLDSISDNYSGDWNSFKYNGRAENFYIYSGFDRKISFSFKIHTQTRWEQKPLWRKLNYLVSQTAPEYKNRRMRGVFSRLTIGDWMNEIPGFFTNVGLSWSTAYPWEIRHDANGLDKDLNEYPHILDVSCDFQPVHNFAPSNGATTPFILPEIGVENNRKYARQTEEENQDEFNSNGIAIDADIADVDRVVVPPPPVSPSPTSINPPPQTLRQAGLSPNLITPVEERELLQ